MLFLGIDAKSTASLLLFPLVATVALGTGRTTVIEGTMLPAIITVYLTTTIFT